MFHRICSDYCEESNDQLDNLYGFLSEPVDNKSEHAKQYRQHELVEAMEQDIKAVYGP